MAVMFAKPKPSPAAADAAAPNTVARPDIVAALRGGLDAVVAVFKKPFVAPGAAFALLLAAGATFIMIAGDPNAGSPSVRISLAGQKAAPPSPADTSDPQQAFTIDGQGLFADASANAMVDSTADVPQQGAVITLPGEAPSAAPAIHFTPSPLTPAPIAALMQNSSNGPMPIIAPNGQTSASAYARPFKSDGRPMVALIVGSLGINPATTQAAIDGLPPQVTLSFVPYTQNLQIWINKARAAGHEVMIEVPMQPVNFPDNDPGPQTLMANARPEDVASHLNWALSRATGFFAVTNYQGGAFFKDKAGLGTFLDNLKQRGVAFVDDGQAKGISGAWGRASADRIIDNQTNATAINAQLAGLESSAKSRGQALGTGFAYPVTLAVAQRWTQTLDAKGLQLAPASAIVSQ